MNFAFQTELLPQLKMGKDENLSWSVLKGDLHYRWPAPMEYIVIHSLYLLNTPDDPQRKGHR